MKAISGRPVKALKKKTRLVCADNSGPKMLEIIAVRGYKGKRRTMPTCGVASAIFCRQYRGDEKTAHQVHRAIVIRQKKEYRRASGMRISFEDNAAIVVDEKFMPKGTLIKGPVAREVIERFPPVAKIASVIV